MFRFNRFKLIKLIGAMVVAAAVAGSCAILAVKTATARETDAVNAAKYDCDRACLQQISDSYFDALAQHNPSAAPFAADVKYSETGRVMKIGEGLWRTAGKPTYRMEIFDPETANRAAWYPHIPCTPPPGGVDDEQRYMSSADVA